VQGELTFRHPNTSPLRTITQHCLWIPFRWVSKNKYLSCSTAAPIQLHSIVPQQWVRVCTCLNILWNILPSFTSVQESMNNLPHGLLDDGKWWQYVPSKCQESITLLLSATTPKTRTLESTDINPCLYASQFTASFDLKIVNNVRKTTIYVPQFIIAGILLFSQTFSPSSSTSKTSKAVWYFNLILFCNFPTV
jgi:hypothetical protein